MDKPEPTASYMSNTKWRKLFRAIADLEINKCTWKLTDEKEPLDGHLPDPNVMGEDYVGDCGALNGPFSFNLIEWIHIPSKVGFRPYDKAPMQYNHQDIKEVERKINLAGNFQLEVDEDGVKIIAHKMR